ncbi:hypothetical protein OG874_21020 [Nocardia sp. NBC_00565]|uniref:hypothetical protein n=1 Tax=Nocardia sp. NBC_00565 TaxID=2975993 RepID=UPI002E8183F1|nr:hypothetical protein [Nocardia sp. NBC_00565]WUC07418.1 hypothetical protein OG874_21020 [Nocardia sp. NBC_00565]
MSDNEITKDLPAIDSADAAPSSVETSGSVRIYALAGAAVLMAVLAAMLGLCWQSTSSDLDALRQQNADRDKAAEVAKDYTLKSLTYDYRNIPAFFDGVQNGASVGLRNRYQEVHDTLANIMTSTQVVATGEVIGTAVEPKDNDQYAVTVFATQRTQNVQQPEPTTVPNLLIVTVAKDGGTWQVVDYGPNPAATSR